MKSSLCGVLNKFEKIYENSLNSVDVMVTSVISISVKRDYLIETHLRLVAFIQNVALVMENKCVKFDENNFNSMEAMVMSMFFKVLKGR